MSSHTSGRNASTASDEMSVRTLYQQLIDGWNRRDSATLAGLLAEDGELIGFDGSQMTGPAQVASELGRIFADHQTPPYVAKVRGVRLVAPGAAILRAVVGMVPPGQSDIDPQLNAQQTLVAAQHEAQWRIALFQTTPAQFHGRPELVQQLTDELRQLL
jgi:uncharacterized protein (TIGR02246 family)